MAKNTDRQDIENFTDSFRGYVRHCSAKSSKEYWLHSKGPVSYTHLTLPTNSRV